MLLFLTILTNTTAMQTNKEKQTSEKHKTAIDYNKEKQAKTKHRKYHPYNLPVILEPPPTNSDIFYTDGGDKKTTPQHGAL